MDCRNKGRDGQKEKNNKGMKSSHRGYWLIKGNSGNRPCPHHFSSLHSETRRADHFTPFFPRPVPPGRTAFQLASNQTRISAGVGGGGSYGAVMMEKGCRGHGHGTGRRRRGLDCSPGTGALFSHPSFPQSSPHASVRLRWAAAGR